MDNSLRASLRPNSVDPRAQQADVFPLQAFEFDDPNTSSSPRLRMKEPWIFEASSVEVGSITLKDLTDSLQTDIEETRLIAEDNQSKIAMQDGSVLIQGEEIELRTVSLDENGKAVKGGSLKLGLDEAGGYTEVVGTLRSSNFDRDVPFEDRVGWRIQENGDAEFNSVKIRGFQVPDEGTEYIVNVRNIPGDGEYGTITEALEFLSGGYPNFINGGVESIIEVEDGYICTELIDIRNVDLGWITLRSAGAISLVVEELGSFISVTDGTSPKLEIEVTDNSIITTSNRRNMVDLTRSSLLFDSLEGYNFNSVLRCSEASSASGGTIDADYTRGTYTDHHAVMCYDGSTYIGGSTRGHGIQLIFDNGSYGKATLRRAVLMRSAVFVGLGSTFNMVDDLRYTSGTLNCASIYGGQLNLISVLPTAEITTRDFGVLNGGILRAYSGFYPITSNVAANTFTSNGIWWDW